MEKAYYYKETVNEDGEPVTERVGPLPSGGDWPSQYAARGLFLRPPSETAGEDAGGGAWRGLWADVLQEGFTLDDARQWLQDAISDEPEDGAQANTVGVTSPNPEPDTAPEAAQPKAGRSK